MARALVNNPTVLLMDEPFAALDAQTRTLMQELVMKAWLNLKQLFFSLHKILIKLFF
ncbi:hypothetical protein ACIQ4Z_16140 [Peribacillus asahii]|uniref:hypothetical protein n=1 Tax=Peribacillus asahii TaxID=228899 RepID=UPI00382D0C79